MGKAPRKLPNDANTLCKGKHVMPFNPSTEAQMLPRFIFCAYSRKEGRKGRYYRKTGRKSFYTLCFCIRLRPLPACSSQLAIRLNSSLPTNQQPSPPLSSLPPLSMPYVQSSRRRRRQAEKGPSIWMMKSWTCQDLCLFTHVNIELLRTSA